MAASSKVTESPATDRDWKSIEPLSVKVPPPPPGDATMMGAGARPNFVGLAARTSPGFPLTVTGESGRIVIVPEGDGPTAETDKVQPTSVPRASTAVIGPYVPLKRDPLPSR